MKCQVVGCKHIKGTNKSGKAYDASLVSIVYQQRGYTGHKAEEIYVDSSLMYPEEFVPDIVLDIDRDNGFINTIEIVKK